MNFVESNAEDEFISEADIILADIMRLKGYNIAKDKH